jgi:hypothetical protein
MCTHSCWRFVRPENSPTSTLVNMFLPMPLLSTRTWLASCIAPCRTHSLCHSHVCHCVSRPHNTALTHTHTHTHTHTLKQVQVSNIGCDAEAVRHVCAVVEVSPRDRHGDQVLHGTGMQFLLKYRDGASHDGGHTHTHTHTHTERDRMNLQLLQIRQPAKRSDAHLRELAVVQVSVESL